MWEIKEIVFKDEICNFEIEIRWDPSHPYVFQPILNDVFVMYTKIIDNEQHFFSGVFFKSSYEINKMLLHHIIFVTHEPVCSSVVEDRDHIGLFNFFSFAFFVMAG